MAKPDSESRNQAHAPAPSDSPMKRRINSFPQGLIERIEGIAANESESFSEIVRRACWAYDPEADEDEMVSHYADAMQQAIRDALDAVEVAREDVTRTRAQLKTAHGHHG